MLEFFPDEHPARPVLLAVLNRTVAAVAQVQDAATGLWFQVLDQPGRPGNYLEASASCMFVYGMAKGVRLGYLPPRWLATVQAGYQGVVERLVEVDEAGQVTLNRSAPWPGWAAPRIGTAPTSTTSASRSSAMTSRASGRSSWPVLS